MIDDGTTTSGKAVEASKAAPVDSKKSADVPPQDEVVRGAHRDLPMNTLYTELVRDALELLDRYRVPLAQRDHVKSLDDREELLRRVRAALDPYRFRGLEPRDDVTDVLRRIDEAHGACPDPSRRSGLAVTKPISR
jgi:hypothetical protein